MCHFLLLPLVYSNYQRLLVGLILLCDTYRHHFPLVHSVDGTAFITNFTEKISKLKANSEIIIIGVLVQPILYIDMLIDLDNIPFHLKSTNNFLIFNNKKKGVWLSELQLKPSPFPINTTLIIGILLDTSDRFNVTYNEHTLFQVKGRDSLDSVNRLHIYGNITLKSVKVVQMSKEEESSMKTTIIIGIAITSALILITGLGIFCILRRHSAHSKFRNGTDHDHDSIMESVASSRSKQTGPSNVVYLTTDAFL